MRRQRAQRLQVILVARVNGIVRNARGDEIVIASDRTPADFPFPARLACRSTATSPRRGRCCPGFVAPAMHGNAPGIGQRLRLVRNCHCRSVKMRQLVDADEKKFGALILVDVVFALRNSRSASSSHSTMSPGASTRENFCRVRAERRGENRAAATARAPETCGAEAKCSRRGVRAPAGSLPSAALSIFPGPPRRRRGDTWRARRESHSASRTGRSQARFCVPPAGDRPGRQDQRHRMRELRPSNRWPSVRRPK